MDISELLEVKLADPDAFLKIRETLTRIGVANSRTKTLYPTCHILHKRGRYYIVTFFELMELDGHPNNMTEDDRQRRNTIAKLLEDWGLCTIIDKERLKFSSMHGIKVLTHKEKPEWEIKPKFHMMSDRKKAQKENT